MSSPFGYNYPAGAEHDPRAPWNQPVACICCMGDGYLLCRECGGEGACDSCEDGTERCRECDGTGAEKTAADKRREWAEDKADIERDDE